MTNELDLSGKSVFVAGHRGMVGRALVRRLEREPVRILCAPRETLDLERQEAVEDWFARNRPDIVILAAAKVGGILANASAPVDFLARNLAIQNHVIGAAHRHGARKLLFLGSSCIYPKLAPQPIEEKSLLTGPLEPTNRAYAIAKIAGLELCAAHRSQYGDDFVSVMPTNLYGPFDNFDLEGSHVLPALLRKIHEAKTRGAPSVEIWGSGAPRREFLYVDDLADACVFVLKRYSAAEPINVGVGEDIEISELAKRIADVVGYRGGFEFDRSKPDGTPRKLLDVSRLRALGWRAQVSLDEGIRRSYAWFLESGYA